MKMRDGWSYATVGWLAALGTLMAVAPAAGGQDAPAVHPAKRVYSDFGAWPALTPGDVRLADFRPFRAVYERHYRDVNGEHREDRVIITAERVAWGSDAAIFVTLVDAGSLAYDDTSARGQMRFFAERGGRALLQVTPAPGTAKDYRIIRAEETVVTMSTVRTSSGETDVQKVPVGGPGWGAPPHWIVASMALESGMKIRLDPVYSYPSSRIFLDAPFVVRGEESVDALGESVRAWVVEHPIGLESARLMRTWVVDRPPYVLGRQPVDADTGEEPLIGSMRLLSFQTFDGGT